MMSEKNQDALDNNYFADLKYGVYGYNAMPPLEYITHIKDEHCPLDKQTTEEV